MSRREEGGREEMGGRRAWKWWEVARRSWSSGGVRWVVIRSWISGGRFRSGKVDMASRL